MKSRDVGVVDKLALLSVLAAAGVLSARTAAVAITNGGWTEAGLSLESVDNFRAEGTDEHLLAKQYMIDVTVDVTMALLTWMNRSFE